MLRRSKDDHFVRLLYLRLNRSAMSNHHFEGHFPEEAEENEIGGPVLVSLIVLAVIVLLIWAL